MAVSSAGNLVEQMVEVTVVSKGFVKADKKAVELVDKTDELAVELTAAC